MERQSKVEEREVKYRGEWYKIMTPVFIDPETCEEYTTTESDKEWWRELRSQYLERHPEVLEGFDDYELKECGPGIWEAIHMDVEIAKDRILVTNGYGRTPEEAIKELYLNLSV